MYDQAHANNSARKGNGIDTKLSEKSSGSQAEWEKFKPKPFDDMQLGMITAFNRYVCYIKPPADNKELQRQYLEVKFARARTYYESQHWEEAAMAFRDIAINHPESEDGIYAAHLYLESLNIIGAKSPTPKPGCFDSMAQDVPKFIGLYCEGKKAAENGEQCELLSRIQCDIERLAAQKKVEAADTGSANARELYLNAGDAYLEIWKKYGEQQLSSGGQSQCGSMDEILFNGAMAYQAGHYLGKAIALRKILTSPKYKLNETEAAQKAVYQLGGNYQAIAVYDLAAKYYLKYARDTKFKGEFANAALKDSVVLFLGLGQDAYAIAAADDYTKAFGARKPDDAAQIGFAIGAHYGEKGDWAEVVKKLSGATLRLIDSKANIDIKLQAHALLGKAYVKLKLFSFV